ncbi:hypothetical protein [Candidatus Uabimicrobium amorphum]|uniref:Uncharacterized protein n=1 Tax=Uabimicrobium amorphum TaxID=2596890 RepID=A0A5S9F153_UABAM|nr:hypothetical protein [Candidatus Uabimicrobium amorphum]BBM81841.1 hypothetical protein UABAM_00181 [Candidatus Uabimicrobium amorphum]
MIHDKKFFKLLLFAALLLSINAGIFAVIEFTITNMTLVFYSLSVPCVWKISSILSWRMGYFVQEDQKERKKTAFVIFFASTLYLFVSILSLFSCVMLFPHPYIHRYLIGIIYSVGMLNIIYLYYIAICIRQKSLPRLFATRYKVQRTFDKISQIRREFCTAQNFTQENFDKKCKDSPTEYNAKKYFAKRLLSTCVYVAIFLWIFVIIPWTSLPEIYFFYKIIFAIVITISSINIFASVLKSYKTCFVYKHGIKIRELFSEKCLFWEQIHYVIMQDVEIEIHCFDGAKVVIPFQDVKRDHSFLESLFHPGEFLFQKKPPKSFSWEKIGDIQHLFKQNNRKISKEAKLEKISSDKLFIVDKDQLFCLKKPNSTIKKSEPTLKVFMGKLPFEVFFMHEVLWKKMQKLKDVSYIKTFIYEYVDRVKVCDEIENQT